ncbi:MAG: FHA domain-containing protein [Proteobacteria bacterium]|nr:FHA domain-containing protein [Pseudomonadota bacterium]
MILILTPNSGRQAGKRLRIDKTQRLNLGRKPENDAIFDAPEHQVVSGFHAQIRWTDGAWRIQDLDSLHGTWRNGQRITTAILQHGDQIRLCEDGPSAVIALEGDAPITAPDIAKAPHSNPVPAPAPSSGERQSRLYGQRTLGLLIQRALESAGLLQQKTGTSKPTAYFEAMLEDKVADARRYSRLLLLLLGIALALILVIATLLVLRYRSVTIHQTTQYVTETAAGGSVASGNRHHIFVMAGVPNDPTLPRTPMGFCTAFAIGPDLLATNAHCVLTASRDFAGIEVRMNGMPHHAHRVVQMHYHPHYRAEVLSPDVALIRIDGKLNAWARLATTAELQQIGPGVPVFLYGFPGRLNNLVSPEATFVRGEIGRLTTFAHTVAGFADNTLLQHSAFVSQGTSGSPMFNAAGSVIGINAGGYTESGQILPGYNVGMRIDLLTPLTKEIR